MRHPLTYNVLTILKNSKFQLIVLPTLILIFACSLRVTYINRSLVGGDENTMLVHLMVKLFGENSELGIRLPSLVFGIASL